ncbi:MAG: hypothetical protein K2Q15_10525 [Burkholderiales bacterium]|nr:hypothetical protein [Burkholderiales bacterium]
MPNKNGHTLIIGGTGMLAQASLYLMERSSAVSLFARTQHSLDRLQAQTPSNVNIHFESINYYDTERFQQAIRNALSRFGAPDIVLAWFHEDEMALDLARQLSATGKTIHFFQVLSSASTSPDSSLTDARHQFDVLPIHLHQIVLGFAYSENQSRWLTHDEISSGVIKAFKDAEKLCIVGTIEPWSDQP